MKYRRLKTLDSTGVPIMRYYKLAEDAEALTNAFYGIKDDVCTKIEGEVEEGVKLIGFSHGGNRLARGLMLLDINTTPVYMGILEEEDEGRPEIGDIVNGYQRVIDTHYDGDEGVHGKNDDGFGVEDMDNPYYLFTIVQPEGEAFATAIDDDDAGEVSPQGGQWIPGNTGVDAGKGPRRAIAFYVSNEGGKGKIIYQETEESDPVTMPLNYGQKFITKKVGAYGDALSTVYYAIGMYEEDGETLVEDLKDEIVEKYPDNEIGIEVPLYYTVTFDSDGGSEVDPQRVKDGGNAAEPDPAPTKEGYTLTGWYTTKGGDTPVVFESLEIEADTTLYAGWEVAGQ